MSLVIHYIDYDPLPQSILQTIKIVYSCNSVTVLRVDCNNQQILKKTVCETEGTFTEEVTVPVLSTRRNTCTISFWDKKESNVLVKRTIHYRQSPISDIAEQRNFNSTLFSNTFILSGDYNVNFITVYRPIEANIMFANAVIGAYGGIIFTNKSTEKYASASFCISGQCDPVLIPPTASIRVAFCINCTRFYRSAMELDIPADGVIIAYTPEYHAIYNRLDWLNSVYKALSEYPSTILLEPLSECKIDYYSAQIGYSTGVIISPIDGNVVVSGNIVSGSGRALAKLQIPVDHEIHIYLTDGALEIKAEYELFIGLLTCKSNV